MKTIRPFLFLVFAGIGSLCGQTNTNPLTVYITYFNTHVQNYAIEDLSGTNAVTNVSLIALNDANNIAFGYTNATGSNYNVYTWTNGVLTAQTPLTLGGIDDYGSGASTPLQMLADGTVFGIYQDPNADEFSGLYFLETQTGFLIAYPGQDFSILEPPAPYTNEPYSSNYPPLGNQYITAVASDGSHAMSFAYDMALAFDITNFDNYVVRDVANVIVRGNTAQSFATETNSGDLNFIADFTGPYSGTTINLSENFKPLAINTNGWVVGPGLTASVPLEFNWQNTFPPYSESSDQEEAEYYSQQTGNILTGDITKYFGSQVWDGTAFHSLNGTPGSLSNYDLAVNLNNQNRVIVQGLDTNWNDTEGYLWQEVLVTNSGVVTTNVVTTPLKSLILSTNVQAQIQNIEPFAISNIQTNSGSATNLPILNILATANVRTYAGLKTVHNGQTNSQPSITNSEIILFSQYADQTWHFKQVLGLDNPNIQAINYNGLITAIGDTNQTSLQKALLAIPVSLSNIDDPTVRNGGNGTNNIEIILKPNTNSFDVPSVAWIAAQDTASNNLNKPRMPWLMASAGNISGLVYNWKLSVIFYDRNGNPYRDFDTGTVLTTAQIMQLTNSMETNTVGYSDDIAVPLANSTNPAATNGWIQITNGASWNIYQDPDWMAAVNRGFFGGVAKLSLMITSSGGSVTNVPEQDYNFRIAGENPPMSACEALINSTYDGPTPNWQNLSFTAGTNPPSVPGYWFAYAIAKEETHTDGGRTYYNQFMDNGGKIGQKTAAWPGHEGRPDWNDDVGSGGSGGYGIFQFTFKGADGDDPAENNFIMPRDWIWNWQSNVIKYRLVFDEKLAQAQRITNRIKRKNPNTFTDPSPSSVWEDETKLLYWESAVITLVNGGSKKYGSGWQFYPPQGTNQAAWYYVDPNKRNYLFNVTDIGIEGNNGD